MWNLRVVIKGKNMLRIENEEEEEEKKRNATGFEPRMPAWKSNVTPLH